MNWKIWTWPGQIRTLRENLEASRKSVGELMDVHGQWEFDDGVKRMQLLIARRALARSKESGLTDDQMAEAFTHLLENKGFEAILQLLTSEELEAVDNMVAMDATPDQMKHQAGAVSALSNLHARLIELEQQAKEMAAKKS